MPPGAKKRRAAKKKKEMEANNNSGAHSHAGDDDQKFHDEKESDGGEDSSPSSQDHHNHQHPFAEAEEEEIEKTEDTSTVQSIVTKSEPMIGVNGNGESIQKVAMDKNSVNQVDRELRPVDDSDSKNISNERVESVKESRGGRISLDGGSSSRSSVSSSSSSSSSDDESLVEKNEVVIETGESKTDAPSLVAGYVAIPDSIKPADFPEVTQVTDGVPVMEAYDFVVGEPKEEAYDPVTENAPSVDLVKPADLPKVTWGEPKEEAYDPVAENAPSALVKPADLPKVTQVTDGVPVMEAYDLAVGEPKGEAYDPVAENAPSVDKVASTADEISAVSSCAVGIAEDRPLPSPSVPAVNTSNGAEHIKGYEISECSDSQPLVASAPRPVQTTSWMSCCGLFEVFTGSNR